MDPVYADHEDVKTTISAGLPTSASAPRHRNPWCRLRTSARMNASVLHPVGV